MSHITIDEVTALQLSKTAGVVRLHDPKGKVLGEFIPVATSENWVPVSPEPSEDELRRREQESESFSTAEVLAHLEQIQ